MSDVKHMHMVADVVHAADGMTVDYGPGELHEPGTLPDGVAYKDVLATPEQLATAPAYAQPEKMQAAAAEQKQEPKAEPEQKTAPQAGKTSAKA